MGIERTLETIIRKFPVHKEFSKDIVVRCPYCGDSVKNPNSCHMYISKFPVDGCYKCHCFLCEKCVNLINFLIDTDLIKFVPKSDIRKIIEADTQMSFGQLLRRKDTTPKKVRSQKFDENLKKIQYIKSRVGEIPDQIKKYIIVSFPFIENKKKREWLNKQFVGFITYQRYKVICRNIQPDGCRYIDCNINMKEDYFLFWTSPRLELLTNGAIYVAEGIFSLLGAHNYLKKNNKIDKNSVFVAAGGKAAITSCLRYTSSLFGIPDWNVVVIGDSEVNYEYYLSKVKGAGFLHAKIIYNKQKEDFGYPDINEVVEIIV